MTVIACSSTERKMIADTLVTIDTFKNARTNKIIRARGGALVGASGDNASCWLFNQWALKGPIATSVPPKEIWQNDENAEGLVLMPDGEILWYTCITPDRPFGEWFAIGDGAKFAMAALMAGAKLQQAVQIACDLSSVCGGPLTELALTSKERRRSK